MSNIGLYIHPLPTSTPNQAHPLALPKAVTKDVKANYQNSRGVSGEIPTPIYRNSRGSSERISNDTPAKLPQLMRTDFTNKRTTLNRFAVKSVLISRGSLSRLPFGIRRNEPQEFRWIVVDIRADIRWRQERTHLATLRYILFETLFSNWQKAD